MKQLLTLITILALAGAAAAQINQPYNEVGIYTVEQPQGCETAQVDAPAMTSFDCHIVLTNPWNEVLGRPVTTVGGIEFRLEIPASVYVLSVRLPPGSLGDCWDCPPNMAMSIYAPVQDGAVTLVSLTLMPTTDDPEFINLVPYPAYPTVPGYSYFAFTDREDGYSIHAMHPVSGSFDVPVFAINWDGELSFCETVPLRDESFGGLKALFR